MKQSRDVVYCTTCGVRSDPSWKFCAACGSPTVAPDRPSTSNEGAETQDVARPSHQHTGDTAQPEAPVLSDAPKPPVDAEVGTLSRPRRPVSLGIIAVLAILVFGIGYFGALVMLTTGEASDGLSWDRLFAEPPEREGGIPWPGWDRLGEGLRGKSPSLSDTLAAQYWWAKMKLVGGMIVGPLLLAGWVGVFIGRRWGRTLLYVYLAAWMSNKILYLMVYEEEGVMWFSIAVGMTVLLLSLLNMKSWKAWIEQQPALP